MLIGALVVACSSATPSDSSTPCGFSGPPYTSDALVPVDWGADPAGHATVRFDVQIAGACPTRMVDVDVTQQPPRSASASYSSARLAGQDVGDRTNRLPDGTLLRVTTIAPSTFRMELGASSGSLAPAGTCALKDHAFGCTSP